jgi:cyanophycinase
MRGRFHDYTACMRRFALGALAVGAVLTALARSASTSFEYSVTGNPADVKTQTQAGVLLHGGGKDVREALEWLAQHSAGGDFVVLQFTRDGAYDPKPLLRQPVDSIERFAIHTADAADDRELRRIIRDAEALYIAASEWNYAQMFRGTAVQGAIHHLVWRGVPIGGSGTGASALGEYSLAGDPALASNSALSDPFVNGLELQSGFLHLPYFRSAVIDTELFARDRMGRLIAAMARIARSNKEARGIGVDQGTAVLIERDGATRVIGAGAAYFLRMSDKPRRCERGQPLTVDSVQVYRVPAHGNFNVRTWSSEAVSVYEVSVEAGVLKSSTGSVY